MTVIQNLDHIRKNYQVARHLSTDGGLKWEVYPWDLNLSWGCLYNDMAGTSLCNDIISNTPLHLGQTLEGGAPSYPTDRLYNVLIERSLTPELTQTRYEHLLCQFTQPLESNKALSHILQWRTALQTWLAPGLLTDGSSRSQEPEVFLTATHEFECFLIERSAFIQSQLNCSE